MGGLVSHTTCQREWWMQMATIRCFERRCMFCLCHLLALLSVILVTWWKMRKAIGLVKKMFQERSIAIATRFWTRIFAVSALRTCGSVIHTIESHDVFPNAVLISVMKVNIWRLLACQLLVIIIQ